MTGKTGNECVADEKIAVRAEHSPGPRTWTVAHTNCSPNFGLGLVNYTGSVLQIVYILFNLQELF